MEFDKAQRISSPNEYCVMLRGTQWGRAEPAKIRFAHSRRDNILAVGAACSLQFGDPGNYNCHRDAETHALYHCDLESIHFVT